LQVLEAAVIAVPDERWGERPLLVVVPQPHAGEVTGEYCLFYIFRLALILPVNRDCHS
jgi:acyl-CoA synthetase (AMP-forming)/AMP-acid ligase II